MTKVQGLPGGFEVPETILRLQFTDPSFDGLEVRAHAAPTGSFETISELMFIDDSAKLSKEAYRGVLAARDEFSTALVEWNLRRNGKPVPATNSGVASLPIEFLWQIIGAWISGSHQAIQAALAGRQISEADIPMELGG